MWMSEHTEQTSAEPADVWARWVEPERWPEHNDGLDWARLDGPLAVGTKITLKPKDGPRSTVRIATLQPFTSFSTVGRLPGCRLRLDHEIESRDGQTVFTHRLTMRGLTTPIFRRLFGNELAAGFPTMLANIAALAERG